MKMVIKFFLIIVFLFCLIFGIYFIYQKIEEHRFKKILQDNDAMNYELTEIVNGEETKVFVRDKTLLIEAGDTKTWVSEFEEKRVAFDDEYRTAIIDMNDESLKVNSLNYTFINDYFDNSNQVFKYLGNENGYFKLQFREKESKKITLLFLNEKTNNIDKMVQNAGNFEFITEFKVEKNKVSKEKIQFPDIDGYRVYDSVNSNPSEESEIVESEEN